jgi:hypothetical protein
MAEFSNQDMTMCLNETLMTEYANSATGEYSNEMLDVTSLSDALARNYKAGLLTSTINFNGMHDIDQDAILDALLQSSAAVVVSLAVEPGAADGSVAYISQGIISGFERFGAVGEIAPYSLSIQGTDWLGRGEVFKAETIVTTTTGASSELGATSATQTLWSALHVHGTPTGTTPTLDVTVESDDDDAWGAGTTVRITHAQLAIAGSELLSDVGPVTDTFWRGVYTVGGTDTPTFSIFHCMAIV